MLNKQLEMAIEFHGHKCPAMPLGFRAAQTAMKVLGVNRSQDKELYVISETGKGHAAGCFLDGIMSATGCTYGKSNIEKKYYNKMAFTLIDVATKRSVRVRLKDEFFAGMLDSPFVSLRKKGVPPQNIPSDITDPLLNKVLNLPQKIFLEVEPIKTYLLEKKESCFETAPCTHCEEMVFVNKLVNDVCPSCSKSA